MLGLGVLAIAPLAVGVTMLTIRHLSLRDMDSAKDWMETPCVIETCEFVTHTGADGGRSFNFVFRYEIDGREYRGDRLDLIIGRMGDDDAFEERVHASFPAGAKAVCYVDPRDPAKSVFDRNHGADAPRRMWLLAFPFVCVGVGFSVVLVGAVAGSRRNDLAAGSGSRSELTSAPGPPPRYVPWRTRAIVLAGPAGSQIAWLFVVAFTFVFIILDGPAAYARLFDLWPNKELAKGRVTGVRELDEREAYVSIYQYTIVYEVDGQSYTSDSYTRGRKFKDGDEVDIEYDPAAPAKGMIAGTRPSNFVWWHSAIPLGVLLLLGLGLGGMYVHNVRALWLLRHGQVAHARWIEPQPGSQESHDDASQIPSMHSNYHFDIDGRFYRARMHSPGSRFARRRESSSASQDDAAIVLYNPRKPAHNIIVNGGLADLIDGCRTPWDHVIHCAPAPLALLALLVLFRGAEFI